MALGHENIRRTRFWRAVVAEFIGSVFIVAVGCGTWTAGINGGETAASQTDNLDSVTSLSTKGKLAVVDGIPLQPSTLKVSIAFGLTYVAVLYCSRSVGDAHINPGVTVALLATRRVSFARGVLYLVAQLAGAVLGAATALIVTAGTGSPFLMSDGKRWLTASAGGCTVPARKLTEGQGFGVEFIASFFFVFVVFACHDKRKNPPGFYQDGNGNNFSTEAEMKASCIARKDRRLLEYREDPFVIGLTYTALSLFAIPFTGGSFNTARSFGPALVNNVWTSHWIYWFGPLLGAIAAGAVYDVVFSTKASISRVRTGLLAFHQPSTRSSRHVGDDLLPRLTNVIADPSTGPGAAVDHVGIGPALHTSRHLATTMTSPRSGRETTSSQMYGRGAAHQIGTGNGYQSTDDADDVDSSDGGIEDNDGNEHNEDAAPRVPPPSRSSYVAGGAELQNGAELDRRPNESSV